MHKGACSLKGSRPQAAGLLQSTPRNACRFSVVRCRAEAAKGANNGDSNGAAKTPEWLTKMQLDAKEKSSHSAGTKEKTEQAVLNLQFESDKTKTFPTPVKTTGLHRAPLSGGVKTATQRYDLPTPAVAVRNLVEQAQFGHLCTIMSGMHHRRCGYPFGTLVDIAVDGAGMPILCLSPLAIHARNIIEEPRCSLVVQMPGWNGLANARVTIFGDVYQLPPEMQASAADIFADKHWKRRREERWLNANFVYFRMHKIQDIYFVGGFGTVQWVEVEEYMRNKPDTVVMDDPHTTLKTLNEMFASDLRKLLSHSMNRKADDAVVISIDAGGADVRVRFTSEFSVERIGFEHKVTSREDAINTMKQIVNHFTATSSAAAAAARV